MVSNKALPWASPVELFRNFRASSRTCARCSGSSPIDLAVQRERERLGEVVNEVGFASGNEAVDQFVDDLADPRLPPAARRHR